MLKWPAVVTTVNRRMHVVDFNVFHVIPFNDNFRFPTNPFSKPVKYLIVLKTTLISSNQKTTETKNKRIVNWKNTYYAKHITACLYSYCGWVAWQTGDRMLKYHAVKVCYYKKNVRKRQDFKSLVTRHHAAAKRHTLSTCVLCMWASLMVILGVVVQTL